jgi:F-type H+-transporting ATPase subunit epsilon
MSAKKLHLTITTPLRTVYENDVDQLTVTTADGELTILPNHVPIVVPLMIGQAMVKNDMHEIYHAIDGGILEVRHNNKVVILSDRSENATEIDVERANEALKRAEALMNEELPRNETEYATLQKSMAKELNRVKIASQRGQRK